MAFRARPHRLNGAASAGASDEALALAAAETGDTAAFALLMRRHERRIYYLHLRFTRNSALAEELCQETFLRAWQKLPSFRGDGRFIGWLARLAYNVFLQQRRRSRVEFADSAAEPEPVALEDAAPELDRLLAVVSVDEQRVLILCYAVGLSAAEIGALLGLPAGTVKAQIHRAKEKIRARFQIEVTR